MNGSSSANKPGNLLVHRMGKSYTSNLLYLVRNAGNPGWAAADPAHRIDRQTSGLVLFAKNKRALAAILSLFNSHAVTKEYLAVVAPVPGALVPAEGEQGTIDLPLGRTDDPLRGQIQAVGVPGARTALTRWDWGAEVAPGRHQVSVRLETGRTHQIRVHLAEKGWPLVGDKLYGGPAAGRHALHARFSGLSASLHGVAGQLRGACAAGLGGDSGTSRRPIMTASGSQFQFIPTLEVDDDLALHVPAGLEFDRGADLLDRKIGRDRHTELARRDQSGNLFESVGGRRWRHWLGRSRRSGPRLW